MTHPLSPTRDSKASARGRGGIPKGTFRLPRTQRPRDTASGAVCGSHRTCHPHPNTLPSCNTNTHSTRHRVPVSKLSTTSSQPTPSGNRLPGICSLRVGGREHQMPKWARWEGRSHMLPSPPLMRPQLWPSHSAPLALRPGLAAVPSPSIPLPSPRTVRQPGSAADHPHTAAHSRSPLWKLKPLASLRGAGLRDRSGERRADARPSVATPSLPFPTSWPRLAYFRWRLLSACVHSKTRVRFII